MTPVGRWVNLALLAAATANTDAEGFAQCLRYSVDFIGPVWCDFFYSPIGVSDISEVGEMTGGGGTCSGPNSAFAWYGQPPLVYLPFPPGMSGQSTGINSARDIVGYMTMKSGGGGHHAFVYKNAVVENLVGLPGNLSTFAFGVNEHGTICGRSDGLDGTKACIWRSGQIEQLNLPIGPNSSALDIADDGRVCGWMGPNVFIWSPEEVIDLGIVMPDALWSFGTSLNTTDGLCGTSFFSHPKLVFVRRSFFWRDGKAQDLGMISPWINCYAHSINDDNIIVGHCTGEAAGGTGFVWKDGIIYDLKNLVPPELNLTFLNAASINNAGQIAATGVYPHSNVWVTSTSPCV